MLVDGSKTLIQGVRHVFVGSLTLLSILYVPQFPLNLLYVSKIVKGLDYSVTFSHSGCIFQDLDTRMRIRSGYAEPHGLYQLEMMKTSPTALVPLSVYVELWYPSGHAYAEKLRYLVPLISTLSVNNEACQFCKQT